MFFYAVSSATCLLWTESKKIMEKPDLLNFKCFCLDFSPPTIFVDPSCNWDKSPTQGNGMNGPVPPFTILQENDPSHFSQFHELNSDYSRNGISPERSSPRLGENRTGGYSTESILFE